MTTLAPDIALPLVTVTTLPPHEELTAAESRGVALLLLSEGT
jgi:hypothetical protein